MGVSIGIAGARGRMGQATAAVLKERADASIAFAFGRGDPLPDLSLAQVVIDFSSAAASAELAKAAAARSGPALVIGATGFDAASEAAIADAAKTIAIVRSGNFSLGLNVLIGLAEKAAGMLGPEDYDAVVFEAHHRRKVDAPSGTALMLGEAVARGRGVDLKTVETRARDGLTGPRPEGTIGFSVMRGGGIVGEHSLVFAAEDEILTLSHSARDRGLFARGAVRAALWAAGRGPGLYDMQQVLGFR
jgi:4-hydroxy-tetrahydrodipicolinate reductase